MSNRLYWRIRQDLTSMGAGCAPHHLSIFIRRTRRPDGDVADVVRPDIQGQAAPRVQHQNVPGRWLRIRIKASRLQGCERCSADGEGHLHCEHCCHFWLTKCDMILQDLTVPQHGKCFCNKGLRVLQGRLERDLGLNNALYS